MFSKIKEMYLLRVRGLLAVLWLCFLISLWFDPLSIAEQAVAWDIRLFWTLIAISPAFLLIFGHEAWRRICPLSLLSQLPKYLGRQRSDIFPKESFIARHHLYLQFALLALGVFARAVFLNSDRWLLAAFLTALIACAIFIGWRYSGKPWCHYFCPMSTVQKFFAAPGGLLESTPHRQPVAIPKSMCRMTIVKQPDERSCVGCRTDCPDVDLEQNYWRELSKSGQSLVYFGYPALLLSFYLFHGYRNQGLDAVLNGSWTARSTWQQTTAGDFGVALALFGGCLALSLLLLTGLERGWAHFRKARGIPYEQARHEVFATTVFCSFLGFYFFGQGSLKWLVPAAYLPTVLTLLAVAAGLWWLRALRRSARRYQKELITLKLRKHLDRLWASGSAVLRKVLGDQKPADLQENEIYWVGKTIHAYSSEHSTSFYQTVLKPLLQQNLSTKELFDTLAPTRAALGVSAEEHHLILRQLQESSGAGGERVPLEDTLRAALFEKVTQTYADLTLAELRALMLRLNLPLAADALTPPVLSVGDRLDISLGDGRKNMKFQARIVQMSAMDLWVDLENGADVCGHAPLPFKAGTSVAGYCVARDSESAFRFLSRLKRKHLDKPYRLLLQMPGDLQRSERRLHLRAALVFKATITPVGADGLEDPSRLGECRDLSAGGAWFQVPGDYSFTAGQALQLDFTLPDGRQMAADARVVRAEPLILADQRRLVGLAVRFEQLHEADQAHLSKAVFQEWSRLLVDKRQLGPTGWKNARLFVVHQVVAEGGGVKSFYLKPRDGRRLPGFKPGQFLTFQLAIGKDRKIIRRCYSLSDSPLPDYFRVSIKRQPAPKDKPDIPPGLSSCFFHDRVTAGTLLEVMQPAGGFYLDDQDARPVVLIGGGIGITPVLSMLNHLTRGGFTQPIYMFLGFRNRSEHVFHEHLAQVLAAHRQVDLTVCYSNPAAEDRLGVDYRVKGYVTAELIANTVPSLGCHYYLCGPPVFMKSVTDGLIKAGAIDHDVRFEAFGPASVSGEPKALPIKRDAKIHFANADQTCNWNDKAKTVLELAEQQGVVLPFGCRAGNCHACAIELKSGEVLYLKNPEPPPESGACLTCIAVPKTDLVLIDPN